MMNRMNPRPLSILTRCGALFLLGLCVPAVLADMLPAGLAVPSSVYGASYADVAVPDAGAAVASAIVLAGAPPGSIVTSVEVAFDVAHEYSGDLAVWPAAT